MTFVDHSLPSTSKSTASQNSFLQSIHNHFQKVLRYEDPILLATARSYIPVEVLEIKAIERMRQIQKKIKTEFVDIPELHLEEALLVELVNWFKTSFFSWVDYPSCSFCSGPTKPLRQIIRNEDGGIRVEVYKCTLCDVETDFPRYNDPAILLKTRKGRCGEWGNCFTLICRAMNYDARLVIDNTDHLWTEVYTPTLDKWLHCDPCENVVDAPLMYECGWKKKLSYIIAYSKDEVQDVTWKYSCNHKDLLTRRTLCTEDELVHTLMGLREKRWETLTWMRKKFVQQRLCKELVIMLQERIPTENEKQGRSSGSLDWRLQRKETTVDPFTWKLKEVNEVHIKYRTSTDTYEMVSPDGVVIESRKGWDSGLFQMENVIRKEESDWKMCYLSRAEDSEKATISWKFRVDNDSKTISGIVVRVSTQVYHSGKVDWSLCYGDKCTKIPSDKDFVLEKITGLCEFSLTANLSGGEGDVAWQHSQIFRQTLSSLDFPLQIRIMLENKS